MNITGYKYHGQYKMKSFSLAIQFILPFPYFYLKDEVSFLQY